MATEPGNTGLKRLLKATGYSRDGLVAAFRYETAFRQEIALGFILIPLALWLGNTALERAVLIMVWLLILIAELVNSAIESIVDRIGDEHHELAGRAKDIGSAVVFVALVNATVVWLLVLFTG
jgi:diacylglycerol kinase (ATP)